jgi:hypothetical protein
VTDDGLGPVRALLEREGLVAEVSTAGAAGEIVAIRTPPEARALVATLAPAIRASGFRYVTIELDIDCP